MSKADNSGQQSESGKIKRPQSAYFLFMNERRADFREKNPDMSIGQVAKGLSEIWKGMSADDKKKYEDMAAKDKERYEKEMEASGAKPTKAMLKKKKDEGPQ